MRRIRSVATEPTGLYIKRMNYTVHFFAISSRPGVEPASLGYVFGEFDGLWEASIVAKGIAEQRAAHSLR
jgi:hypothetical protein